jgi:hypothetical protein
VEFCEEEWGKLVLGGAVSGVLGGAMDGFRRRDGRGVWGRDYGE